ncbi:MAG: type II secretion system F family protein [Planctomycetaceae bacterium]|nr:type II secretion system F family protein [Planctomycetaceae bacterium]
MPDFAYVARDVQGKRVSGTISAGSEREAVSALSGRSLFPLQVKANQARPSWTIRRRVKGQQLANLYAQLSALLRSGVPLLRSLEVIKKQSSNQTLQEVLEDVRDRVEDGANLSEAMKQHEAVFGELAVSMVRAGSEGGFLEDSLARIAEFTEQQEDLKSRTMGALAYPMFLGVVGTVVVFGLLIFFVPNFGQIFEELRNEGQLPLLTEWLMWTSDTMQRWGFLILLGIGILVVLVRSRLATPSGRRWADSWKIRLPVLGNIFLSLAVARFCRVLGTLLKNGVPILKSLDISRDAAGNRVLSEAVENAAENISAGDSLAAPLSTSGHFPTTVVEMIAVAEESNTLDSVLIDISDSLEKQTSRRLDLAVRLLEPIMLLILAGIVLLVVIALLLPIFKMSSTI